VLSSWKKKLSPVMCLIASTFVEIVRYLINTVHWLSLQAWRRTTPILYTQRLTPWQTWLTQSMWVTDSRILCPLPRSCVVHPVDYFDSEEWFSSDQVIFLTTLCFLVKKHAAFKWKDAISRFPVSPGNAEASVRWGGKIKYVLIAYFLGSIIAKNCCNRTVYVKVITTQRWDVSFETWCTQDSAVTFQLWL